MSEKEVWTLEEVAAKADWEGGWDELYRWGSNVFITPDSTFNWTWKRYCEAMRKAEAISIELDGLLDSE